jgi:hypothetical protein
MKKLLVLVVLCGLLSTANAADVAGKEIGITFDATFMSKYIWRGFDLFDDKAAWQPSVDLDLGSGFHANIWASYAGASGFVNGTEYDYSLYYVNSILDDCYKTDYKVGWRYYDFIDNPSDLIDMQEVFAEFAMPQLIGGGVVPHGAIYHMWQARSGGDVGLKTGQIFLMGFDYNFTMQQMPELPMTFSWDIVYNGGVGSATFRPNQALNVDVDNDWSHMLWGLKTNFKCPMTGATITPAVYFQNSFDSSVNNEDELFAGLSYTLKF